MIVCNEVRCSDCLNEFNDSPRFAVIKEDTTRPYNEEERLLSGHLFEVLVCGDCVKWYEEFCEVSA